MNKALYLILFISSIFTTGCGKPDITDDLLDGKIIFDASLYEPEKFLVSAKYPNPTTADLDRHILIAVHGYSATTFEWQEFADWTTPTATYRTSQVLLGNHGTTYDDFKNSSWKDWKSTIMEEYEKLEALGYKKISFVGSSTAATLILELISSNYFNNHLAPKNIFFIDPIVVSSVKIQSIAGIVGPMIVYSKNSLEDGETKYWYTFRPEETIRELNKIMKIVRKDLESGFKLPKDTYLKSFHSKNDPTASSTSTVLIYKGLKTSNGNNIDIEIMDSEIHVFTRLAGRKQVSNKNKANQLHAFNEMFKKLE